MKEERYVVGWISFLVTVLVVLGVAGIVLGISLLVAGSGEENDPALTVGAALFFLQATLAFGFALRALTRR